MRAPMTKLQCNITSVTRRASFAPRSTIGISRLGVKCLALKKPWQVLEL